MRMIGEGGRRGTEQSGVPRNSLGPTGGFRLERTFPRPELIEAILRHWGMVPTGVSKSLCH